MKKVMASKGLLGALVLLCASAFCFLGSLHVFLTERQLPESTITAKATVVDKELWVPKVIWLDSRVHYEITYSFSAPSPKDGETREYTETAEVSRNRYNALRLGDEIVITYPTGYPYRSVLGTEFKADAPWAFPLVGLLASGGFLVLGRRRLLAHLHRQHLACTRRRER
jgi:hypothetical protein